MDKIPRVALLIESSRGYGRGLLLGIADYVGAHGPWSIYHHERALGDPVPAWMRRWHGDGIIARIANRRVAQMIARRRLPTVELRDLYRIPGVPVVENEPRAVVRMAVDHLLERGFTHLAYCGLSGADYSERRQRLFVEFVAQAGQQAYVYTGRSQQRSPDTSMIEAAGLLDEDKIAKWLGSLPKPVGVMAANDVRAQQVLNACIEHKISVPGEVAVIGVNNDELVCEMCHPTLTSVEPNTKKIGYEAACLLDQLMKGRKPFQNRILVEPVGVVARESTNVMAMQDRDVAAALQYIRDHACEGISVNDVGAHVFVSISTLHRRFSKIVGRTPRSEIVRVQLNLVKELLRRTDFPLSRIAERTGFNHVESMCHLFKTAVGMTPGQFRKQSRIS
ncbi:MAG: DNA-binding transcriptional regulator [Pirellulales bacterium]|nr:DNA-binding transcriptional regulator [Pirellulales bacterium]